MTDQPNLHSLPTNTTVEVDHYVSPEGSGLDPYSHGGAVYLADSDSTPAILPSKIPESRDADPPCIISACVSVFKTDCLAVGVLSNGGRGRI